MRDRQQSIDNKRKYPIQERAKQTLRLIFEATAQVLQNEGEERLTTNRIAERAGFGVGTLYQYFPNKNALLVAMANHERERVLADVKQVIKEGVDKPLEYTVRRIVQIVLKAFNGRFKVRRLLIREIMSSGKAHPFIKAMDEAAQFVSREIVMARRPDIRTPTDASIYVMSRALLGTVRSSIIEESFWLKKQEFEDELVLLLTNYLRVDGARR